MNVYDDLLLYRRGLEIETLPIDTESFVELENIREAVTRWTRALDTYDVN